MKEASSAAVFEKIKIALHIASILFQTAFSRKLPLTLFWKTRGQWYAYLGGTRIPVVRPQLASIEYYRKYIPRENDIIYDVGGEFGIETNQFATLVGKAGQVHVFECLPSHIDRLRQLKDAQPQIFLHEVACWNMTGTLEFFLGNTPGSGTAILGAKGQHGQALANMEDKAVSVPARKLDDIWNEHGRHQVNFLKMDIEGAEYEALEGASELLQHTSNAAIAAYHVRDGVPTAARVQEILDKAGFHTRVDENLHVYAWR